MRWTAACMPLAMAAALACTALAGCAGGGGTATPGTTAPAPSSPATPGAATPTAPTPPGPTVTADASKRMTVYGVVVDPAIRPVQANVTVVELRQTQHGDRFRFNDLAAGTYFLRIDAGGYANQTLAVTPQDAARELRIVLEPLAASRTDHVTVHHHGILQCWVEAGIIPAPCDYPASLAGQGALNSTNVFDLGLDNQWRTVVGTLDFDLSDNPGFSGLRATVQGTNDNSALGTYEQYGRFNGTSSFSFRMDPGQDYPEGTATFPANVTALRITVYPNGQGWHATCEPPISRPPCALGAGAGVDVEFDLYLTTFYGIPAPPGYTFTDG